MPGGLNILLLSEDAERFRGALMVAMTHRSLGDGPARLFLQLDAVRLIAPPVIGPHDANHQLHGLPSLGALIEEALDDGVGIIICQSGLILAGLSPTMIDERIETGGLTSFLASVSPTDRVMMV